MGDISVSIRKVTRNIFHYSVTLLAVSFFNRIYIHTHVYTCTHALMYEWVLPAGSGRTYFRKLNRILPRVWPRACHVKNRISYPRRVFRPEVRVCLSGDSFKWSQLQRLLPPLTNWLTTSRAIIYRRYANVLLRLSSRRSFRDSVGYYQCRSLWEKRESCSAKRRFTLNTLPSKIFSLYTEIILWIRLCNFLFSNSLCL